MSEIMAYNVLFGMTLVDFILKVPDARRFFLAKLDLIQASDEVYLDISQGFKEIQSGIDFVMSLENPDTDAIKALFIFMGSTDPTGLLYQPVIHKHIKTLMQKQVPLHDYFDSPLAHIPEEGGKLKINMQVYD